MWEQYRRLPATTRGTQRPNPPTSLGRWLAIQSRLKVEGLYALPDKSSPCLNTTPQTIIGFPDEVRIDGRTARGARAPAGRTAVAHHIAKYGLPTANGLARENRGQRPAQGRTQLT